MPARHSNSRLMSSIMDEASAENVYESGLALQGNCRLRAPAGYGDSVDRNGMLGDYDTNVLWSPWGEGELLPEERAV